MKDLYEKICMVIGQVLCYSKKVAWASAPIFDHQAEGVTVSFKDYSGSVIDVFIPFALLIKAHDHTLETLIFSIMKDEGLL